MKAIVGLGNPGQKYASTRHNAGFWLIDQLAERLGVSVRRRENKSLIGMARRSGTDVLLVKPQTFMNESGRAVRQLVDAYGIPLDFVLVCYDDLDLPPGAIRLRPKGGAGGHNGVRSVINYLGTPHFPRLRIGIGAVPDGIRGADYVLGAPVPRERELLEIATKQGAEAALLWVEEGIQASMSRYNRASGQQP